MGNHDIDEMSFNIDEIENEINHKLNVIKKLRNDLNIAIKNKDTEKIEKIKDDIDFYIEMLGI